MSLLQPTDAPTTAPTTFAPTTAPTTFAPTTAPTTSAVITATSSMSVSDNNTMVSVNKSTFDQYCSTPRAIYSVFHTIMFFIAIFLSLRCNRGFSLGSFLIACFCPPIYIFYILITEYDKGICDLIPSRLPLAKY